MKILEGIMPFSRREFMLASGLGIPAYFTNGKSGPSVSGQKKHAKDPIHDTWIDLNLQNMAWNLKKIKEHVKVPVMAVIKANAYGHGLVEVGRFLDNNSRNRE